MKKMKKRITRRDFIKKTAQGAVVLGMGGGSLLLQGCSKQQEYDLLVAGGTVFDGLGNPGKELDIAVKGQRIQLLKKGLEKSKAKRVIEVKGMAVAPGFIDAHDHTDIGLLANPKAESQVRQGVTTVVSGNCGSSPFPIPEPSLEEMKHYVKTEYNIDLDWLDISGFFKRLQERGIALNYSTLVGHGNIRGKIVGLDDVAPTGNQIKEMQQLVSENIKAGALGISTGLEYSPGSYAKTPELIALCQAAASSGGVYATHMRHEGEFLLEALDEAITISRESGISLQISHLKVANKVNWDKIDAALAKIETARKEGIRVLADRYPYIAGSTGLAYYFPPWSKQGTTKEFIKRLKDPALESKLRTHLKQREEKLGSWDKVVISSVYTDKNKKYEGKNILECSKEAGQEPYEFMRDLLIQEDARVSMIAFFASEDNLRRILAHPLVVVGADGAAVAPYGVLGKGKPHPRLYGSFSRMLGKYVREEKILSLPLAIQKMSSTTAHKFGIKERGQIREGYYADLVSFDPDKVIDKASWQNPHQYPEGILDVVVNGEVVIHSGEHSGKLPGSILRKSMSV
jgi:N-acyl-D-amino-acid deacylase